MEMRWTMGWNEWSVDEWIKWSMDEWMKWSMDGWVNGMKWITSEIWICTYDYVTTACRKNKMEKLECQKDSDFHSIFSV